MFRLLQESVGIFRNPLDSLRIQWNPKELLVATTSYCEIIFLDSQLASSPPREASPGSQASFSYVPSNKAFLESLGSFWNLQASGFFRHL